MVSVEKARDLIANRPWHHAFEIVPGVRTQGSYDPRPLWNTLELPDDLTGLSLADIGASNGFFSFEARRRGARVVAFDFRHKDNSGFGLAQYINGLTDIDHHQINVNDISAARFGQFDIVLAIGLLYHLSDPYRVLARCAEMCSGNLYVESYCIDGTVDESIATEPIMRFIPDVKRFPHARTVANDRSNFWGFTSACLRNMVEDIGFQVARSQNSVDRVFLQAQRDRSIDVAATRNGLAYSLVPRTILRGPEDDPASWSLY